MGDSSKHVVICPHCGGKALDHMTKCPECGGELTPTGYRPFDAKSLKRFKIAAWVVLCAAAVVIVVIMLARGNGG